MTSIVSGVDNDPTFPLPRGHIVKFLKDGFLYTYGNNTLKMYDVNLRAEVLSLQMPEFNSVVAQGDHFAVSYTGGFKVYRKFFVDNEYEVDLKYEVNDMGSTYLALRGNTMVAYDNDKVRIYRFNTVKEFRIENGDELIIGDNDVYIYTTEILKSYGFDGTEGDAFTIPDSDIERVQYLDEKLYITAYNQTVGQQTIIIDFDSGTTTTATEFEPYIYDNRIYKIYEEGVKLNDQLIYEIPPNKDINRFFASGGYICMVDRRLNVSIIQNTSIIQNDTQWVREDITYKVSEVFGDFVTITADDIESKVLNKTELISQYTLKMESGFDWEQFVTDVQPMGRRATLGEIYTIEQFRDIEMPETKLVMDINEEECDIGDVDTKKEYPVRVAISRNPYVWEKQGTSDNDKFYIYCGESLKEWLNSYPGYNSFGTNSTYRENAVKRKKSPFSNVVITDIQFLTQEMIEEEMKKYKKEEKEDPVVALKKKRDELDEQIEALKKELKDLEELHQKRIQEIKVKLRILEFQRRNTANIIRRFGKRKTPGLKF